MNQALTKAQDIYWQLFQQAVARESGKIEVQQKTKSSAYAFRASAYAFAKLIRSRAEKGDETARARLGTIDSVLIRITKDHVVQFIDKSKDDLLGPAVAALGGVEVVAETLDAEAMASLAEVQQQLEQGHKPGEPIP